jgi:iron complex outermembrane receptor protein
MIAAAPEYIANVRVRYTPAILSGFSSMLAIQSIGEYWLDDANSQDAQGNDRKEDGYTTVNLKARYQLNDQVAIHARLLNDSDDEYV